MAHGTPDDYNIVRDYWATVVYDDAELAVRLGAPNSLDRTGTVVWFTDFSDGLGVILLQGSGTGYGSWLVNQPSLSGGVALELQPGNTASDTAQVVITHRLHPSASVGFEFAVNCRGADCILYFEVWHYDGTNRSQYSLYILSASGQIAVMDSDGNYYLVGTANKLQTTWGDYHRIKLVLNVGGGQYAYVIVDEHKFDLSSYKPYVVADSTVAMTQWVLKVVANENNMDSVFADEIIITCNEEV